MVPQVSVTLEKLATYDDWGRAQLLADEGHTYSSLRRLLEHEHCVTAADNTMRRWLAQLHTERPAISLKRPAAMVELVSKSQSELAP